MLRWMNVSQTQEVCVALFLFFLSFLMSPTFFLQLPTFFLGSGKQLHGYRLKERRSRNEGSAMELIITMIIPPRLHSFPFSPPCSQPACFDHFLRLEKKQCWARLGWQKKCGRMRVFALYFSYDYCADNPFPTKEVGGRGKIPSWAFEKRMETTTTTRRRQTRGSNEEEKREKERRELPAVANEY